MKRIALLLFIFALVLSLPAVAQCGKTFPNLNVLIAGHSETRTMYYYLLAHPQQLCEIPIANIHAANHDSMACPSLSTLLPFDYQHQSVPPDITMLWIGGPDAEQDFQPDVFQSCLQQVVQATFQYFPNTVIVLPNVPADTYRVPGLPADYLDLIAAYNSAIAQIASQYPCNASSPISCIVPVNVHDNTIVWSGQYAGWGNPNLTYIDFYDNGWVAVMPAFRSRLYPMLPAIQ